MNQKQINLQYLYAARAVIRAHKSLKLELITPAQFESKMIIAKKVRDNLVIQQRILRANSS